MELRNLFLPCLALFALTGCHIGYFVKNGAEQARLLVGRESVENVLNSNSLTPEEHKKLLLSQEILAFIENDLQMKTFGNYRSFIRIPRSALSYVLTAAEQRRLETYKWNFPIVGSVPYLGFFDKADALAEAEEFKKKGYDISVRGVGGYSSLGWIKDPIPSTLLKEPDEELVDLLIHETVHANIYISGQSDFNERLATFLGAKGTEIYYLKKEGAQSPTLLRIQEQEKDRKLFSEFLAGEIENLKKWLEANQSLSNFEEQRQNQLKEIQTRFVKLIKPKMKTPNYQGFGDRPINHAVLLSFGTYYVDLEDFQKVYRGFTSFQEFFKFSKSLEKSSNPADELKRRIL